MLNSNNREDLNMTKDFNMVKSGTVNGQPIPRAPQSANNQGVPSQRPGQPQQRQGMPIQRPGQLQQRPPQSIQRQGQPQQPQGVTSQGQIRQSQAQVRQIRPQAQHAVKDAPTQAIPSVTRMGNETRSSVRPQTNAVPQVRKPEPKPSQTETRGGIPQVHTASVNKPQAINKTAQKRSVDSRMMKTRVDAVDIEQQKKEQSKIDSKEKKSSSKKNQSAGVNTVMSIVKAIVYIIFVIVVSVFLAVAIIKVGNDVFAFVKSDEPIEITIPENATTEDISDILADNDVIEYPEVFKLFAKFKKYDNNYVAGDYTVTPSMNYEALVLEFKPKSVAGTIDITIPEGYTTDEIIDLFVSSGIGTREGFVDVIQNGEFDYWFVDLLNEDTANPSRIYRLDGYLFPDTYQFYLASSEWTIVNKLLRRFSQIFTREYREQCEALGYTVDEIVTLASIIEKEAASPSEFFLVSSVFHNRMNASWAFPRLESDATVVYAIEHETGERNVDLYYDTPYNTYKYEGFPPGPISNPSASAMLAALSPLDTNYYYFISNNNVTYFSASKAEHDAYVEKFKNESTQQTTGDVPNN